MPNDDGSWNEDDIAAKVASMEADETDVPLNNEPPPFDRPEPPEPGTAAYTCEHGASNVPCICHMVVAQRLGDPRPQTMPDDWHHFAGGDNGGVADKSNVG